ncbi:hypothetical protein D1227_06550 [Henriciella mobilis]|uniref:hypothetical protein n=1 Tax=Henriciella mobilis TaxID=2305467 RepID=UPI000E668F9B|nr:hypothetical protein [Henriciella mobilis]RIJ15931.1 hypothetical protein D1231_09050 [Henriciella mobilis]RIJ21141.1 hypothetical protein D1227_12590 [Henriciella mobilis]RIJ23159.1 hypothetical protein D1227_06550 [Henriciella mobilis]
MHYIFFMSTDYVPRSFRFTPEEAELLDQLKEEYGSYKAALMAGLRSLKGERQPVTKADVMAWVEQQK